MFFSYWSICQNSKQYLQIASVVQPTVQTLKLLIYCNNKEMQQILTFRKLYHNCGQHCCFKKCWTDQLSYSWWFIFYWLNCCSSIFGINISVCKRCIFLFPLLTLYNHVSVFVLVHMCPPCSLQRSACKCPWLQVSCLQWAFACSSPVAPGVALHFHGA